MSEKEALQTKRHHVTREDEADRDLNGTQFSKGAAALVTALFLAFIFGIPIAQNVVELRKRPGKVPKALEVYGLLPTAKQMGDAKGFWGYWGLIPSTEAIEGFEKEVKESSILTQAFLSPAQQVLTGGLGVGNEKAYVGRNGWLFYRPDVEYLTSDGFLSPEFLKARSHGATAIQPDPVKAILDMKAQLAARGIVLVVVPMPTKPMVHPEMLVGPSAAGARLQNPSFGKFVTRLEEGGVQVFDPSPILWDRARSAKQYLETDTHWTPDAMEAIATRLAGFVQAVGALPPIANPGYVLKDVPIASLGDIAEMLKLPKGQKLYQPQSVTTHQVQLPDGTPWASQTDADVLLLGDSFSNIFSLEGMNWGAASGFAEHLSYRLGRPVDKIAINAGGSFASRRELARTMQRADRLAGKRVVIYEFSMRDLSQGDWKMITFPKPSATPTENPPAPTPPTPPTPTPTTESRVKILGVEPGSIDPTKGESVVVRVSVPKGSFSAIVLDPTGKPLGSLGNGSAETDGEGQATWDGKGPDGKPVPSGVYRVVISGTDAEGKPQPDVSAPIVVRSGGALPMPKIEPVGANPERIAPKAKETTTADFLVPNAGTYTAEVLAQGRVVRRLGSQSAKPGVLHVTWNGTDQTGKPVPDGAYRIHLRGTDPKLAADVDVTVKSQSAGPANPPTKATSQELVVSGRILARAATPQAGAYKDAIIAIELTHVRAISGTVRNGPVVVYVWGMRDNKLVDGAYRTGQTITLKLVSWDKVEGKYGSYNRLELDDDSTLSLPTYWGENQR